MKTILKHARLLSVAFLLWSGSTMAYAQDKIDVQNWSELIAEAQIEAQLVGVGGVVFKDGELIETAVAGEKQLGSELKIEPNERWHIGSITKPVTATMIARLVEQGTLSWDDSVEDILGTKKIHKQWQGVTFRELLTHTSGAKANFSVWTNLFQPKTPEKTLESRKKNVLKMLRKKPKSEPGTAHVYSNVGFTIAAHLAEVKTGKSWETLMREEVFEPLELTSAGFGPPKPVDGNPVAWGHRGETAMDPSGLADNSPMMGPAGNLHMTLQDLAKFGQAHVDGVAGRSDYLSQETFAILHAPRLEDYAMGWMHPEKSLFPDTPMFWHNGSNKMWYALLIAAPEDNMVYALVTNSGKIQAADRAFAGIIKTHYNSAIEVE